MDREALVKAVQNWLDDPYNRSAYSEFCDNELIARAYQSTDELTKRGYRIKCHELGGIMVLK